MIQTEYVMAWGSGWYTEWETFPGVMTWSIRYKKSNAKRFKSKKEVIDRFNGIHAFPEDYIHMVHSGYVRAEKMNQPQFEFERA